MKSKNLLNWFLNLKIGLKLTSAFLIIALLQVGIGFIALTQMGKINDGVNKIYDRSLIPSQELGEARNLVQQLRLESRDLYLYPNDVKKKTEEIKEIREQISAHIEAYGKSDLTKEQKVQLAQFYNKWESHNISYDQAVQLALDGKSTDYLLTLNGGLLKFQNAMFEDLNELMQSETISAEQTKDDTEKAYSSTLIVTISIISFIFLLSILFGLLIARIISRPLGQVADLVEKAADGDLSEIINIDTKDEVGALAQSINKMMVNFRTIVQNILSAAENLSASSKQVSARTEEIAHASTNQASAAKTMNDLFKELADAINSIARNTEEAAGLANQTIQIAQDGEKAVLSSVEGTTLVSSQMARLEEGARKIGEIIEVIGEIADQTNLLALNAAIEAARAGEQGRGFAVVADEVRKLAERSVEATDEISSIIQHMQEATLLSIKSVEDGVLKTQKSGEAFEKIISMIQHTGSKVTEIASASEEQAAQSSEVLSFINSISSTTEETAASSEETALTANTLTDLASALNTSVAAFKLRKDSL